MISVVYHLLALITVASAATLHLDFAASPPTVSGYLAAGVDNTVSFTIPAGKIDADDNSGPWLGIYAAGDVTTLLPDSNAWYRAFTSRKAGFTWGSAYIPGEGTYDFYMVDNGGTVGDSSTSLKLTIAIRNECIAKSGANDWSALGCKVGGSQTGVTVASLGLISAYLPEYSECHITCPSPGVAFSTRSVRSVMPSARPRKLEIMTCTYKDMNDRWVTGVCP